MRREIEKKQQKFSKEGDEKYFYLDKNHNKQKTKIVKLTVKNYFLKDLKKKERSLKVMLLILQKI